MGSRHDVRCVLKRREVRLISAGHQNDFFHLPTRLAPEFMAHLAHFSERRVWHEVRGCACLVFLCVASSDEASPLR